MNEYPNFREALMELGETHADIARKLNTSQKTVDRLRKALPKQLKQFERAPHLLRALADDMERQHA